MITDEQGRCLHSKDKCNIVRELLKMQKTAFRRKKNRASLGAATLPIAAATKPAVRLAMPWVMLLSGSCDQLME